MQSMRDLAEDGNLAVLEAYDPGQASMTVSDYKQTLINALKQHGVKSFVWYQTKAMKLEGQPCKQGQSASRTGCTPKSKPAAKASASNPVAKPTTKPKHPAHAKSKPAAKKPAPKKQSEASGKPCKQGQSAKKTGCIPKNPKLNKSGLTKESVKDEVKPKSKPKLENKPSNGQIAVLGQSLRELSDASGHEEISHDDITTAIEAAFAGMNTKQANELVTEMSGIKNSNYKSTDEAIKALKIEVHDRKRMTEKAKADQGSPLTGGKKVPFKYGDHVIEALPKAKKFVEEMRKKTAPNKTDKVKLENKTANQMQGHSLVGESKEQKIVNDGKTTSQTASKPHAGQPCKPGETAEQTGCTPTESGHKPALTTKPVSTAPVASAPKTITSLTPQSSKTADSFSVPFFKALEKSSMDPKYKKEWQYGIDKVTARLNDKARERISKYAPNIAFYKNHSEAMNAMLNAGDPGLKAAIEKQQKQGLIMGGGYTAPEKVRGLHFIPNSIPYDHFAGYAELKNYSEAARHIIAHELGHAIDGPNAEYSKSWEWTSIWVGEVGKAGIFGFFKPKEAPLSEYARTSKHEGFAEFARLLYASDRTPAEIEERFPRASKFFKDKGLWVK